MVQHDDVEFTAAAGRLTGDFPDLAEQRQLLAEPRPRATVSAAAAGPIV